MLFQCLAMGNTGVQKTVTAYFTCDQLLSCALPSTILTTANLKGTCLCVHWEILQMHRTARFDCDSKTQNKNSTDTNLK